MSELSKFFETMVDQGMPALITTAKHLISSDDPLERTSGFRFLSHYASVDNAQMLMDAYRREHNKFVKAVMKSCLIMIEGEQNVCLCIKA